MIQFIFNPFTGNFDAINTGSSITLSAVGSTPNANAATLTGSALNLEPANSSFPGVVTTATQSFSGQKTFLSPVLITTSATDAALFAEFVTVSNNTTVDGSNNLQAIQTSATGTVQSGATNDKAIAGWVNTVQRGDGTDDGVLHELDGSTSLLFHNPGTLGVTDVAVGYDTVTFTQQGTITDLYDFRSERIAAGGVATNHYGLFIKNDSTTPVKNWLSGSSLFGRSSFTTPAATVDVYGNLALEGSTSGTFTQAAADTTTSYSVKWPSAQGAANEVLTNDGAGNLSWASGSTPTYTQFTLANNQSSPADITGWLLNSAVSTGFTAEYSILRDTSGSAFQYIEDTTFDINNGTGSNAVVRDSAIDGTGRYLIAGDLNQWNSSGVANGIVRLSSSGTIDATFNTNAGTGADSVVQTVTTDSTNAVIIGGYFNNFNANTAVALAKLDNTGAFDATFGGNIGTGFDQPVFCIAVDPANDSMVVGGQFTTFNGNTRNFLVRLNSDGTEDTTFATNLGTGFDGLVLTVKIDSNSKIVVGGTFNSLNGNTRNYMVRLNADGTEDTSFYTNLGTGFNSNVVKVGINPDNSVIVYGDFTQLNGNTRNHITKVSSTGLEDSTFVTNIGTGFTGVSFLGLTIAPDTTITLSGTFTAFNGNSIVNVAQLNANGTFNSSFAAGITTGPNAVTYTVIANSTSQIVMAGNFTQFNGNTRGRITRFGVVASTVAELVQEGTVRGLYRALAANWSLGGQEYIGDDAGVTFSITSGGQVQYTTTNMPGVVGNSYIRFLITRL